MPIPGGAQHYEDGLQVTSADNIRRTIEVTWAAFLREGLDSAWERVQAVVVQPGVEFGSDFVLEYQPQAATGLVRFIEAAWAGLRSPFHGLPDAEVPAQAGTGPFCHPEGGAGIDLCLPRGGLCPGVDGGRLRPPRNALG